MKTRIKSHIPIFTTDRNSVGKRKMVKPINKTKNKRNSENF